MHAPLVSLADRSARVDRATIRVNRLWVRNLIRSIQFLSCELVPGRYSQLAAILFRLASKGSPLARTLQAIRASLLAKAVASLFRCSRVAASVSHGPKLNFCQLCGRIRMTWAAWMNRVRRHLLPRLDMRPRIGRPPVLYWHGTRQDNFL